MNGFEDSCICEWSTLNHSPAECAGNRHQWTYSCPEELLAVVNGIPIPPDVCRCTNPDKEIG
jgi:hypothetical protein